MIKAGGNLDTSADDTNQTQAITGTDNPQAVTTPFNASESKNFQQAAGLESLQQSRSLQVINEGPPIQGGTTVARPVSAYVPLVLVILALILISMRLIRWVKSAPDGAAIIIPDAQPAVISKPAKKPKKTSRAKRRKK